MPKKNRAPRGAAPAKPPVLQGDCFRTFLDEARSIGNEVAARRQFAADVIEFLRGKGLIDEWDAWHAARRGQ